MISIWMLSNVMPQVVRVWMMLVQIIDAARYKPTTAKYKIYIIDECHMLSQSQALEWTLLKTLEEPPDHLKFIFCNY